MYTGFRTSLILLFFVLSLVATPSTLFAQSTVTTDPIADFCASPSAQNDTQARAECAGLMVLQDTSAKIKSEKDSIATEIKGIDTQIKIAQQKIKVQNRIIDQLTKDIKVKTTTVTGLTSKIDKNVESVARIIKELNGSDATSLPSVILGQKNFSSFYTGVDQFQTLNRELTALIDEVRTQKKQTEVEKQALEDRKDKETNARQDIEAQKRLIDRKKAEKDALLAVKTNQYTAAQKVLLDQKAKVAQIRARLFKFQDGEGIPFGDAYDFAVRASKTTGVRPAFVLGILMQESSYNYETSTFGKNVGQCYVRDTATGNGVGATNGDPRIRVMNPTRDVPIFITITGNLGRDYANTKVSCWIVDYSGGQPTGWGGAMGPAQFIASTWDLYKNRIASALGVSANVTDPWNPEHAITAASLYLADLGAGGQTYTSEKNAACKYYSGKKCTASSRANTYGTSAMRWVTKIQEEMIDTLASASK
ncbi:MAG: hypothetical protein RLZZ347_630 [Candidatus Parcubacteria bacterium]|jgi:peptidoglycan hydrolase CwlO-like protein